MKEQRANQLFIFKRENGVNLKFELFKRIIVKDIPIFSKVCMQFYFENVNSIDEIPSSLIFVKQDRVIKLNFLENVIDTIYEFKNPLLRQPEFF